MKWEYVYQVFMAKSTFFKSIIYMLHLVYCIKDRVQGYCLSSSFILGYFIHWRDVHSVLAVCVYVLYSMCELDIPALGVLATEPYFY